MQYSTRSLYTMIPNIVEFISQHPVQDTDVASIERWRKSCQVSWSIGVVPYLSNDESSYGQKVLDSLLDSYIELAKLAEEKRNKTTILWSLEKRKNNIEALLNRPQLEQRTEGWYLDALGLLSASQFSIILKPTRARGHLVLQKASTVPIDTSGRKTVVRTDELTAFTWGIRFEPVVKQLYEHLTNTKVAEMGRLKHAVDPRIAASPDGLVVEGPDYRLGRFVEFKAPVTRTIVDKIPEEYMAQMQIQMEVGNVEECDYLEVTFNSQYGSKPPLKAPDSPSYVGSIYIVGDEEGLPLRYEYSPLQDLAWKPTLQSNEQLLESIPWWSSKWFLIPVGRSRSWFTSVQPAIQSFWEDVEKAKQGLYVLQPSSRKPKESFCKIVDEDPTTPQESTEVTPYFQ